MTRLRNPTRLSDLVRAASKVFLEKGYRLAQVADAAREMGVAPGTVYLYVESKEALFDLVIRCALDPSLAESDSEVPLRCPDERATLEFVRATLEAQTKLPLLKAAVERRPPSNAAGELDAIVRELFAGTAKNWQALKLLERCATDWPELAQLWFGEHRPRIFALFARYLASRMATGRLRAVPDPVIAARLIIEMVATFAMHCRADRHSPQMDEKAAEDVVVDAVVHAYRVDDTPARSKRSTAK